MMTNRETTAAVRRALRNAGIANGVRVRTSDAGYSTAIRVTVNDPAIDRREVESAARRFESVDRCEATGEVLEGGNVYVRVEYAPGVFDEVSAGYVDEARGLLAMMDGRECVQVAEGLWLNDLDGVELHQSGEGRRLVWSAEGLAEMLYKFRAFGNINA